MWVGEEHEEEGTEVWVGEEHEEEGTGGVGG